MIIKETTQIISLDSLPEGVVRLDMAIMVGVSKYYVTGFVNLEEESLQEAVTIMYQKLLRGSTKGADGETSP